MLELFSQQKKRKIDLIRALTENNEPFFSEGLSSTENHFKKIDYSYIAK